MTLGSAIHALRPRRRWWLVYAVFLTLVYISVISDSLRHGMTLVRALDFTIGFGGLVALYALGAGIPFISRLFWKVYLAMDVLVFALHHAVDSPIEPRYLVSPQMILWLALMVLPYYAGIYRYAFRSSEIWDM